MASLLLLLAGHPDHRQFARVPFQVTRQTLTECGRVARIGLHPAALLIEFAWGNDIAVRSGSDQLPVETGPKAARFINHVHSVALAQECLHPWHELLRPQTPRRLGQKMIILRYRHVQPRVHVQTDLDLSATEFYFSCDGLE